MKIQAIKIDKLFGIFNYEIPFNPVENILIVTGPNGFGKTMILNILNNLFNRRFWFFQKLVFNKIEIYLDDNTEIHLSKKVVDDDQIVNYEFFKNDDGHIYEIGRFDYSVKTENIIERNITNLLPFRRISSNTWVDGRNDRYMNLNDILNEYADIFPRELLRDVIEIENDDVNAILNSIPVHMIKEQRLFKKSPLRDRRYREESEHTVMTEAIQTYANELKLLIYDYSQRSFKATQELDSSYPMRLTSEVNVMSEAEYKDRYIRLKEKQEKLTRLGLYASQHEFLTFNEGDAKALSVYIKDLEVKLSVFDGLLEKLELFTQILNERRFTFKKISINKDKGFYFATHDGNTLELNQLSSGEQHEVVLLYELIFNVVPNILVLIDEPEISLHVTWQKEFLRDLTRIVKIQNIHVIIATHSPSIINDRWDLVYNLEKKS